MLKYVFAGSHSFSVTVLDSLCRHLYPPGLVVTQPPRPAGRGKSLLPTCVQQYSKSKSLPFIAVGNINGDSVLDTLKSLNPDLILVAAFGQIFKKEVLAIAKLYCLNVHASLLPKYRGAAPIQWAIWSGEKSTGITIQKMRLQLDAGDILLQKKIAIGPQETSTELLARLALLGGKALVEAVKMIESGADKFMPQDPKLMSYAPKIKRSHSKIDWTRQATFIHNQVRSLLPWPVAETSLGGERLKIFRASIEAGSETAEPGRIFTDSKSFLRVGCGENALSLLEVQMESRKRMVIAEFLKAYRGKFPYSFTGVCT